MAEKIKEQQDECKIPKKNPVLSQYDDVLTRMAIDEIKREISGASLSESKPDASKSLHLKTNKRFLQNTIRNAVNHNTRKTNKCKEFAKKKFIETLRERSQISDEKYKRKYDVILID